jgi:hypothetical protein
VGDLGEDSMPAQPVLCRPVVKGVFYSEGCLAQGFFSLTRARETKKIAFNVPRPVELVGPPGPLFPGDALRRRLPRQYAI